MNVIRLDQIAEKLPAAWSSSVVGQAAQANLKVLRMDASEYAAEVHDYAEALLVLTGSMKLEMAGRIVTVGAGELMIIPPGQPHAVAAGSYGTLLIIDAPA